MSTSVIDINSIPHVETRFRSSTGNRPYVRLDCPFDETAAATGGLSALGVFFEEDINAGLLDAVQAGYPEIRV